MIRHSPGLNGQQKPQGSPNHTTRPSLTSTASLTSHAGPKSRLADIKYRKTSQPLCSKQSPHIRSRVNKLGKELKEHKKTNKLMKKERKGEEKKRRKKKEEKHLADRKKKRDKAAKKERKLGFKDEKEAFTPISAFNPSGETKTSKMTTQSPEGQVQLPPKHKRRVRSERAERTHKPSTNPTLLQRSSKSENPKMSKKNRSLQKPPVKEQLKHFLSRNTSHPQHKKKPAINSSQSDRPNAKSDDTLPSLLLKALAPLTTGCSVSLEKPIHGKEGGQGAVLNAPDLQPVAVMGNLQEMGDNLANTPPVLSWQGSPVSTLGEEEEEMEKGVMIRPVLQPSPTQCFSPPHADTESFDDLNKEPCEGALASYSQDAVSKVGELPCATEQVAEEEKDEDNSEEISGSLLCELRHHKTGLDDVFKSLTTFVEGQRVSCRGGPFGGPTAGVRGVKYSSSLELVPEIASHEQQDFCLKPDHPASSKSDNQSLIHTTSDTLMKSHNATDLREAVMDAKVQVKEEETHNDMKVKPEGKDAARTESSLHDRSLSAKLRLTTTTHTASFTSHVTVSTKQEREYSEDTQGKGTDRKRKQKAKGGGNVEEIKIQIKAEESRVIRPKSKANEISTLKERETLVHVISRNSARLIEDSTKGQIPQENQTPHGKDIQREGNAEGKKLTDKTEEVSEFENPKPSTVGSVTATSPSSASAGTISTSKLSVAQPASKAPCSVSPVDPLKLKALSMGLSKELKILLIKVESAGRHTFNISEVEEQRIPLCKISINNTASQVVRACK